jgi:hypothetical protein
MTFNAGETIFKGDVHRIAENSRSSLAERCRRPIVPDRPRLIPQSSNQAAWHHQQTPIVVAGNIVEELIRVG